jgi:hypothetical protein
MKKLLFIFGLVVLLASCDATYTVSNPYYDTNRVVVYRSPYYYNYYRPYVRITPPPRPSYRPYYPQHRPHHYEHHHGGRR